MTTAIIAEKPSLAQLVLPSVDAGEDRVLGYASPFISLNSNFDYPRGLKWTDYPAVRDVRYKAGGVIARKAGGSDTNDDIVAEIRACRRVILMRDPDPSSTLAFHLALRRVYPDGVPAETVFNIAPTSYKPESVEACAAAGLRDALPIHGLDPETYRAAEIKRRFDYNFNLNSFAILGEVMRVVGATGPALTKVGIQTLYLARDAGPLKESEMDRRMQDWKGTGRYAKDPWWLGLGSIAARAAVVEGLADAGLLDREGRVRVLSYKGRRLLDLLHPGCEDPDQPFRIEEWSRLSREEAYPKVDRYVRSFFGRQKRFAQSRLRP
jgi:hypothetical protein